MSTASRHKDNVLHNENLLNCIDRKGYSDWTITILFYAAVHVVEYMFADNEDVHCGDHMERNQKIETDKKYVAIRRFYRKLYDMSKQSRYDCIIAFEPKEVKDAENYYDVIKQASKICG